MKPSTKIFTSFIVGTAFLLSLLVSTQVFANNKFSRKVSPFQSKVRVDVSRLLIVDNVIRGTDSREHAGLIRKYTKQSKKPIYMYLDSPGGSVVAGLFMIHEMEKAKAQGVKFICVVDKMAASMAFQYLAHCDTRLAHRTSSMLWHPVRVNVRQASITPTVAKTLYLDLKYTESAMLPKLIKELRLPKRVFFHHYNVETLHFGSQLAQLSPRFLQLIDRISNYQEVLDAIALRKKNSKKNIFSILFGRQQQQELNVLRDYSIDYTYPEFVKEVSKRKEQN